MSTTAPETSSPERERAAGRLTLRQRLSAIDQGLLIAGVTVGLLAVGAVTVDGMLTAGNLLNLVRLSAALGILAAGSAIVIMAKGVDLSVATVSAISGMGLVHFWQRWELTEAQALLMVLLIGLGIGLLNGWLVAYVEVPALFVTLATWLLFDGLFSAYVFDTQVYQLPADSTIAANLGRAEVLGVTAPVIIVFLVFAAALAFERFTSYGLLIRATGENPQAARLSGAPTRPLVMFTFVIAALSAVLVGVLLLGINGQYSTAYGGGGVNLLFNAITAAVIGGVSLTGGKGTIFGVLAGTAFIAVFGNLMTLLNVGNTVATMVQGAVLVFALAFDAWLHPRDEETAKSDDL